LRSAEQIATLKEVVEIPSLGRQAASPRDAPREDFEGDLSSVDLTSQ